MQRNISIDLIKLDAERKILEEQRAIFDKYFYIKTSGISLTPDEEQQYQSALRNCTAIRNSGEMQKLFLNHYKNLHDIANDVQPVEKHCQLAISMLENGENLHSRDAKGRTPLCIATANGHTNLMLIFLSWGAKVKVKDTNGYKPSLFRTHYTCDHEYDKGGCIPLKRYRDEPKRELLRSLEILERRFINKADRCFDFQDISSHIVELLTHEKLDNVAVRGAVCGYVVNNVRTEQKQEAFNFLTNHYKNNYNQILTREDVNNALSEDYFNNTQGFRPGC